MYQVVLWQVSRSVHAHFEGGVDLVSSTGPLGRQGSGGCFSFGGTVQYIEESNIYLCFVVYRLKRGLVT